MYHLMKLVCLLINCQFGDVYACYAPINVFPYYPPFGVYSGGFDSKPFPHPGAFDLLLVFYNKTLMSNHLCTQWGRV